MKHKLLKIGMPALIMLNACQSSASIQAITAPQRSTPTADDFANVTQALIDIKCRLKVPIGVYEACLEIVVKELPQMDAVKRDYFGENYDPAAWRACMQRGNEESNYYENAQCNKYILRRLDDEIAKPKIEMPEIKWPRSSAIPAATKGMSNREYFRSLCENEAGELIYRSVENVSGVLQMKPTFYPTDLEFSDRYVLEDPYSITRENTSDPWESYVQPVLGRYDFFDVWSITVKKYTSAHLTNENLDFSNPNARFVHFFRDSNAHPGRKKHSYYEDESVETPDLVNAKFIDQTNAIYGYTWRGIGGAKLREYGIAGGDQAVVDLRTGEVLAIRRGFLFSDLSTRGLSVWWLGASNCSKELATRTSEFVKKVLKPTHPAGSIH
jgi:hypothetical protein